MKKDAMMKKMNERYLVIVMRSAACKVGLNPTENRQLLKLVEMIPIPIDYSLNSSRITTH